MSTKCPYCGNQIKILLHRTGYRKSQSGPRLSTFQSSTQSPFHNVADIAVPPVGLEASRETPIFLPTFEAHVKIPMTQAIISGAFIAIPAGLIIGSIVYIGGLTFWSSFSTGIIISVTIGFVVAGSQWWSRTGYYNNLLWKFEQFINKDIDGDGQAGQPEPHRVQVELKEGRRWQFAEFTVSPQALYNFACIVHGGQSFCEQVALDNGLTRNEFISVRDKFLDRNWLVWNHPTEKRQGLSLTLSGKSAIRQIANTPPSDGLSRADVTVSTQDDVGRNDAGHFEFIEG